MGGTIHGRVGFLKMNMIGYKDVFLSNHRTQFNLTAYPIITSNGRMTVKLWNLKNSGIKLSSHTLLKIIYIINPENILPREQAFFNKIKYLSMHKAPSHVCTYLLYGYI